MEKAVKKVEKPKDPTLNPPDAKIVPDGTVFIVKVPVDRAQSAFLTYYLKEVDRSLFLAAREIIRQGNTYDACIMLVKALALPGSDSPDPLLTNFIALNSLMPLMIDVIEPVGGELKKNY